MSRFLIVLSFLFTFHCAVKTPVATLKAILTLPTSSLTALRISSGTLTPSFSSEITNYSVTVANATTSIAVTPTVADTSLGITVNGTSVASGTASSAISLSTGSNTITITVGGISSYTILVTRLASDTYRIFLTSDTYDGNLSGIAGADTICNSDSNKPENVNFKAFLSASGGSGRRACSSNNCGGGVGENFDWVLKPSSTYLRNSDLQTIFVTNTSGIFVFGSLTNSFVGSNTSYWTGKNTATDWGISMYTCSNWTSTTGQGRPGTGNAMNYTSIGDNQESCATKKHLLCVEQ